MTALRISARSKPAAPNMVDAKSMLSTMDALSTVPFLLGSILGS